MEEDDPALDAITGGVELAETVDDQQFGFDAGGRRTDAVAEPQHRERMPSRRDDLQALGAANPMRHLDRIEPHVEAVAAHFARRPLDGGVEVLGAAQAMAEGVAELCQPVPGE